MPTRFGRKCVKGEELCLQCEWDNCGQNYNDLSDFYVHLLEHFQKGSQENTEARGPFCCQWNECVYITDCQHDLLRHLYFHGYHTKVKWWGLLCYKKQKLNECQALHNRNIIPELPEGFKCEWKDCYMLFDVPDQFYMHVYNHALFAEEEKVDQNHSSFKCLWEGCSYSYIAKGSGKAKVGKFKLREHLRSHTKERCYACPWCGNLYVNRTKFTDHLNRQMNIESHCYQCTHCSRTFATERLLKDHMRHHVNYYKCPKCAMTCPNPSGLKHHMKYKHSDERPFACHFCEYRSKSSYDLQVHLSFHQSDLSYRCHVKGCDYAVRSLQNLRYHFRTKHMVGKGKCYQCHLCKKTYGVGFQLTNHLRTAHGFQWPPGHSRFKYKECDDGFFRLQTFRFESVELTEKLMVDDQSTSNRTETTSCKIKKQSTRAKSSKAKKKRFVTKHQHQQLPSITTRSATLLLQKAQSQRLNRSLVRMRNQTKKLNKKRGTVKNHSIPNARAAGDDLTMNQTPDIPTSSALNPISISYSSTSGLTHDILMAEFGGKSETSSQTDTVEVLETLSSTESSSQVSNEDHASVEQPNATQPSLAESLPAMSPKTLTHGTWVSDENGAAKTLVIDGEKFYLLKCVDSSNTVTYSLVCASGNEGLPVPLSP